MKRLKIRYGEIQGYENLETHPSGHPASLIFTERFEIDTPVGRIIPQYSIEDHGRKVLKPACFYENGILRKTPVQDEAYIETPYGTVSAEMVLFYDDESLKKIFPLNGKLSGYWGEKDEYALCEEFSLALPSGPVNAKVISLTFYRSQRIRSLTLWPGERIEALTPAGTIPVRVGLSFYENGAVKSAEPAEPCDIHTPIGTIAAYDNDPLGIVGDVNSLKFDSSGALAGLSTVTHSIRVTDRAGEQKLYTPGEKKGLCSDLSTVRVPLVIEFMDGNVRFHRKPEMVHSMKECTFELMEWEKGALNPLYECG